MIEKEEAKKDEILIQEQNIAQIPFDPEEMEEIKKRQKVASWLASLVLSRRFKRQRQSTVLIKKFLKGYKFRKLIRPRLIEHRENRDGQRVFDLRNWLKAKRPH